eukprot:s1440_g2.t1
MLHFVGPEYSMFASPQSATLRGVFLRFFLAGAVDGTGSIWDLEGPTKVQEFHHGAELHAAAVSPDGKFLGTAGADGQVILWQREPLDVEFNLQGHQGQVYSISFSPDCSSLFSASGDATARLWDICSGEELLCLRGHRRDVNACAISPDGHILATGRTGQQLQHWDGRRGEGHSGRVYAVAFDATGRYLATGAVDKKAKIWDLRKGAGRCLQAFTKHTDLVNSVEFSADGKLVASASDDAFVYMWKAEDASVVASHEHPMPVMCATFSEDGRLLASGCSDGRLRFWKDSEQVYAGLGEDETCSRGGQKAESLERLELLPPGCRTLAVGEGDFVFSEALATARVASAKPRGPLVVTCLESEAESVEQYSGLSQRLKQLRSLGAEVLCGVDATRLREGPLAKLEPFERIVFNFPLLPMKVHKSRASNNDVQIANRAMLVEFLRGAASFLRNDGVLLIANKDA